MKQVAVMKYWFFNGEDVIGPFLPQQLASRSDFLATSLICPEHASTNSDSWQPAYRFAEFHFDEVTGKLALINEPEAPVAPTVHLRKRPKKPAKPIAHEFIRLSKINKKEEPPTPVALTKEGSVDLVLPQPVLPPESTPAVEQKPAPKENKTEPVQESPVIPSPAQSAASAISKALFATGEGYPSSCVLPIVPERINEENLPFLPEGDGTYTSFVAEPDFSLEDEVYEGAETSDKQEAQAETPLQVEPKKEEPVASALVEEQTETTQKKDVDAVEPKLSQVRARLVPTPEIEEFLTDHQFGLSPKRKGHPGMALAVLIVLLIPGIVLLLMQTGFFTFKTADLANVATTALAEQDVAAELIQPQSEPAPAVVSVNSAEEEKALLAVQNYVLPANKGTISSYFAKLYQERLAQGYTASWSVEPLHNSTYIVKYRVAKTRTEPIVYVFQADAKKNQLTGALNNVALDLVGKI